MKKNIIKIISTLLLCLFMIDSVFAANNNTSLKDLKDKLKNDEAKLNSVINEQNKVKNNIKQIEGELDTISKEIEKSEKEIEESRQRVAELEEDISEKKEETSNLFNFFQKTSVDNVYLEYIFKAKSFSDFIYRKSVVEQLTNYNDEVVDEMYNLIEENKKEQERLNKKIEESEKTIAKLNTTLKKYNMSMEDLADDHKDAAADYEASKKEVAAYEKMYKENNCSETTPIIDCIDIPYADGFIRPTVKGSITSEYGLRLHPTLGYYRMHNGVDIGVSMNTNVYAAAAGIVSKIVRVKTPNVRNSSCGGNMVYVLHRIGGKEYTSVYMHLHSISVSLDDFVTTATVVGKSGGGESYDKCTTGPHLHFGIMKGSSYVNPRNYVNFPKKGVRWSTRY